MRKKTTQTKKFHSKESYFHLKAKEALKDQLLKGMYNYKPLRVDLEPKFCMNGMFLFIPDVVVYEKNGISAIFEVVHTSQISYEKRVKMNYYFEQHNINPDVIEISANEILRKLV